MNARTVLGIAALNLWLAVSPSSAQYTASLTMTCKAIGFGQGVVSNSTKRVMFTTYDGPADRPLANMKSTGRRRTEITGGEFRPDTNAPGCYIADYMVLDSESAQIVEYGSISITLPVDDEILATGS